MPRRSRASLRIKRLLPPPLETGPQGCAAGRRRARRCALPRAFGAATLAVGSALAALLVLLAAPARAEVVVDGVGDPERANILAHMNLDEEPCDAPQWRIEQQ